jgi:hypothetical protein
MFREFGSIHHCFKSDPAQPSIGLRAFYTLEGVELEGVEGLHIAKELGHKPFFM